MIFESCFWLFFFAFSDTKCLPLVSSGVDFKMKTIEIDGTKVRVQIWYVALCWTSLGSGPHMVRFCSHVPFVFCAGTQQDRNGIKPSPSSTTGGQKYKESTVKLLFFYIKLHYLIQLVCSCAGHRICVWHHERAVLSEHSEVGQWRGWSKAIRAAILMQCT